MQRNNFREFNSTKTLWIVLLESIAWLNKFPYIFYNHLFIIILEAIKRLLNGSEFVLYSVRICADFINFAAIIEEIWPSVRWKSKTDKNLAPHWGNLGHMLLVRVFWMLESRPLVRTWDSRFCFVWKLLDKLIDDINCFFSQEIFLNLAWIYQVSGFKYSSLDSIRVAIYFTIIYIF